MRGSKETKKKQEKGFDDLQCDSGKLDYMML